MTSRGLVIAVVCAACAAEQVRQKPEAPDMTALVEGYANPSRNFDEPTAIELQALVESKVAKLFDLDALSDTISDALAALGQDELPMAFAPPPPIELEGEGFARITRICRGHGTPAPPVDQDANGYLDLTVGYTQAGLDPVVFGTAVACQEQVNTAQLAIAGAVNLYIGENLELAQLVDSPVILQLADFEFSVDGRQIVSGGFDFQVCRGTDSNCVPENFEILIGLEASSTIVFFIDLATRSAGFRGANGIWSCDFLAGLCTDGAGGVVQAPGYQL